MRKTKNEKGVATLFVLISGLFFIAFIMGILILSSTKKQTQIELGGEIQSIYNQSNEETVNNIKNIVPIYTADQLLKMGSGEEIPIEQEGNKKYLFSETAQYVLCDNIELNYIDILDLTKYNFDKSSYIVTIKKIVEEEIDKEEVNYYYMKNYDYPVTATGLKFDGLVLQYDGIDNIGNRMTNITQDEEIHSNITNIWKDLSGNKHDGILNGFSSNSWNNNSLNFDGVNNYITIQKNPIYEFDEYTMHFVIETNKTVNQSLFCNREITDKGRTVSILSNNIRIDNGNSIWETTYNIELNIPVDICIVRNSSSVKLYINGELRKYTTTIGDRINLHENISTIGASQIQTSPSSDVSGLTNYFSGKMYNINIYNKELTDIEVRNNYEIMKDKLK